MKENFLVRFNLHGRTGVRVTPIGQRPLGDWGSWRVIGSFSHERSPNVRDQRELKINIVPTKEEIQ